MHKWQCEFKLITQTIGKTNIFAGDVVGLVTESTKGRNMYVCAPALQETIVFLEQIIKYS